jgi:hypothetical protein
MRALALPQQAPLCELCRCMAGVIVCCGLPPSLSSSSHRECGGSGDQWLGHTKAVTQWEVAHECGKCYGIHMSMLLATDLSTEVVLFVFETCVEW